jgi:hypothetical protein
MNIKLIYNHNKLYNLPIEGDLREQALKFEKNSTVIPRCQISVN